MELDSSSGGNPIGWSISNRPSVCPSNLGAFSVCYRSLGTVTPTRARHSERIEKVVPGRKTSLSLTQWIHRRRVGALRRKHLRGIEGVAELRKRLPGFTEVRQAICAAGTDSAEYFGKSYTHKGGLSLQQNPDEFGCLCLFLEERGGLSRYAEVGTASGGTCRFLQKRLGFERVVCLDDGNHPRAKEQDENLSTIENWDRFVGDSHSPEARVFLKDLGASPFDVIMIDGDHSYEGVVEDVEMMLGHCRRGTLMILHDTVACEGVERAWLRLVSSGRGRAVAEFIDVERPLGIGVCEIR